MKKNGKAPEILRFPTLPQSQVPHSRRGRHHDIVNRILDDIGNLGEGDALKVPLDGIGDTKEKVRSALNRASRKRKIILATATDDDYLYVWARSDQDVEAAD
ncbi:MAG TPA: hypothetical protein VD837_19405 [Terriglobales bacterium]|nr:hypothetical protein [Terriglobales bacterium]